MPGVSVKATSNQAYQHQRPTHILGLSEALPLVDNQVVAVQVLGEARCVDPEVQVYKGVGLQS